MVVIEYLNIKKHQQLGDIEIGLSDINDSFDGSQPYTSVIIGPNGTGKSYILRELSEIFRQFKDYALTGNNQTQLYYTFHLRYRIDYDCFEIVSSQLQLPQNTRGSKSYRYFKNRPQNHEFKDVDSPFERETQYDINLSDLKFPESVLSVSLIHNDRFTFKNSKVGEFYQYLGLRSASGSTSTRAAQRKAIRNIFSVAVSNEIFIENLGKLLLFLDFQNVFKVQYTTRYNNLFFSGQLTKLNFRKFYEAWWEEDFNFSKRKKDNPPWSKGYYDRVFKDNDHNTEEIINFLNLISTTGRLERKPRSSTKTLMLDFLSREFSTNELILIQHLENLDILGLNGIKINKANKEFSTDEISSGESSLLLSIVNIFSRIQHNSLILIDEPEISLHPNWQLQYMSFLKKAFSNFSSCHFIITTHSHFIVSDLDGKTSSITALSRDSIDDSKIYARLLEGKDTYGWSAEEVLYKVFRVKTTRNYYLEEELRELLHLIAIKSDDKLRMKNILATLKRINLSEKDPMKLIIKKAEEYLDK